MAELYDILDANEIDGQAKDIQVTAVKDDIDWTKVLVQPAQELPEGNYDFVYSFQTLSDTTGKDFEVRMTAGVILPAIDFHIDKLM